MSWPIGESSSLIVLVKNIMHSMGKCGLHSDIAYPHSPSTVLFVITWLRSCLVGLHKCDRMLD
jgi:hypothetical protein